MFIESEVKPPTTRGRGKRQKKVGVFRCDQCMMIYEDKLYKQNKEHHFCSTQCVSKSKQVGGILFEKTVATNYKNFGAERPIKNPSIKHSIQKTNKERYGGLSPFASPMIREKSKLTMIDRYGVDHSWKDERIRKEMQETLRRITGSRSNVKKRRLTNIERYGVPCVFQAQHVKVNANSLVSIKKCHMTKKVRGTYGKSRAEDEFFVLLCDVFGLENIERCVIVEGYEIDFYISSINVYIQFDGVYWHGLDRPISEIKKFKTKTDVQIYKTYQHDQIQKRVFNELGLALVRITDIDFYSWTDRVNQLMMACENGVKLQDGRF